MNKERLRKLVRETDCKPDPESETMVDALIEVILNLNADNKIILDMIWHPEKYERTNSNKN